MNFGVNRSGNVYFGIQERERMKRAKNVSLRRADPVAVR